MGVDGAAARFLGHARSCGVDFTRTLTIGRQHRYGPVGDLLAGLAAFGLPPDPGSLETQLVEAAGFADPVFEALGADHLAALDHSPFEGATLIHDLNQRLPDDLAGRWDVVFDGGASEHVFNFPVALETTMRLVAPGGHLISVVPTNQQVGHGFYQVGPEVYFGALVPANGFELLGVHLLERSLRPRWYRIQDPAASGRRLSAVTLGAADLYVLARRTGEPGLHRIPQQQDYAAAWEAPTTDPAPSPPRTIRRVRAARLLGPSLADATRTARRLLRRGSTAGMERVDLAAPAAEGPDRSPQGPRRPTG